MMWATVLQILCVNTANAAPDWDGYVEEAMKNNPLVQAKYVEYEAAIEHIRQVGVISEPSVGVGVFVLPIETKMGAQRAKFSIQQSFPWWGTYTKQKQLAKLQAEQKKTNWEEAQIDVRLQMEALWFPMIALTEQIAVYEESMGILESYARLTQRRLENGQGNMVDSLQIEMRVESLKTEIQISVKKLSMLKTKFNILCNEPQEREIVLPSSESVEFIPTAKDPIIRHPRGDRFDLELVSKGVEKELVGKQRMPSVGVGIEYIVVSPLADNPQSGGDAVVPTVRLQIPLFQNRYQSQLAEISSLEKSSVLSKEAWEQHVHNQLTEISFAVDRCIELRSLYRDQKERLRQSIEVLLASYSVSGDRFEELLQLQQELLRYQILEIDLVHEYRIAIGKQNSLTGESNE